MGLLFLAMLCAGIIADPETAIAHVRTASPAAHALLTEAIAHSAIVNGLIEHLAWSDTIVYVEIVGTPEVLLARTKLVSSSPEVRFLRISINARTPTWDRVALLAHELQHAVEIAHATDVRDDDGVRRLYSAIGYKGDGNRFETAAARETERRVRAELARRDPR